MGARLGSSGGPMADINVTPLIDVVLVLLVVFMVITPMLTSGLPLDIPKATQTDEVKDMGNLIVISVAHDGRLAVGSDTYEDAYEVVNVVQQELAAKPEITAQSIESGLPAIIIKADYQTEYHRVREVLDLLAENRIPTVGLAANKEQ
jgi:biopolymer transport protein ExbD